MGHSLEKNLQRVQSYRERGQLDRALRDLQEWARKYPDTPHYLYEAAMVAFDLEDWTTGIHSLRSLLRSLPDTREKVLAASQERFADTPALPLAEFLVDACIGDQQFDAALGVVERLEERDVGIYVRKATMRHQSLVATEGIADPARTASFALQIVLACASGDGPGAAAACAELLAIDPRLAERIETLIARAVDRHPDSGGWMLARARILHARGASGEAATLAAEAARREAELRAPAQSLVESMRPEGEARGTWSCARGDLALLAGDGAAAARHFVDAADALPRMRDELIARIARAVDDTNLTGSGELLKLRLRLLVVQKRFEEIPGLAQRLLREGLAQAQELRSLLGEGRASGLPGEMLAVLAETALRDGDLAAAATHAHEIPAQDDASLQRLLRAIESESEQWPSETRVQLDALRAVLEARGKNRDAANSTLASMWTTHRDQLPVVLAVTQKCLDIVAPVPSLVRTAFGPALDAGMGAEFAPVLTRLLGSTAPKDATSNSGRAGFLDQEAICLDFGENAEPDEIDELSEALLGVLDDDPRRGTAMLQVLDGLAPSHAAGSRLRHAVAMAALHAGEFARALPEIAVLVMMAEPDQIARVGAQVDRAIEHLGPVAPVLVTRADLHADVGEIEAAAERLAAALKADPSGAEDLTRRFERLIARADDEDAETLWRSFAEALFEVGRHDQLADVCGRALTKLPSDRVAPFLVLQARVLIVQGRITEALQMLQQQLVNGRLPAELAMELLQDVVRAHPASSIAQLMLGHAASRADRVEIAIDSYLAAVRLDRSLLPPVSDQIQKLMTRPGTIGAHAIRVGAFFVEVGDSSRAASAYEKALHLDHGLATRVLGELGQVLDRPDVALDLLQVGAQAARVATQVERACELLLRLDHRDPAHFEFVLSELRHLREACPAHLLPASCIARVLLHHDAPEAAVQSVIEAGTRATYPLALRVEMLHEFHRRHPHHAGLTAALAARLGEQGNQDAAVERFREAMQLPGFDAERAVDAVSALLDLASEHPQLRLLQHDLLLRVGRIDEALRVLPDPAALGEWQQSEISERLAEHIERVQASVELTMALARSLCIQGRAEDAIVLLQETANRVGAPEEHFLWTELARLLHAAGRTEESQAILLRRASDANARREAYRLYGTWNAARIAGELRALHERHRARPKAAHIALQLADKLLEAGRPGEVPEVLRNDSLDGEWRARRGLLLGRAHLDLGRADRAEAILLDARAHAVDAVQTREIDYRLAECAQRLCRPAAAAARLADLLDAPELGARADHLARRAYQFHLEDVSGSYRAVLTRETSLCPIVEEMS